jgi:chromosome segregation protein
LQLTVLTDARFPLHAELRRLEAAMTRSAQTLDAANDDLLGLERAHNSSELAWERARDEAGALRRQVRLELDIDDADSLIGVESVASDDDGGNESREREINRLRERLRRVGFVGQDVVADFERESAHQAFLRQQLDDVEGAALALRGLLVDLHQSMRTRFDATFAQVSTVFSDVFATLFGGGAAQLILTGGERSENGTRAEPGVDIVAQPPGKRLQNLALLSGGERALTAVALLFAILRVNPAPFCLLDEVDAALDEANVVRFRDQLGALAAKTQVVIVTHNRGTIETADTLYGVSMGPDGVSNVLSMRMAAVE